ncbi:MAG: tetraacyldisaccharide 4'-kinase [Deltaproteobacteria bacterium]
MDIRSRIESVMYGGNSRGAGWLGAGLAGMALLYGAVVRLRKIAFARGWLKTAQLDCRVVSVGNITMGGTGKTPMTFYLARLIQSCEYRVVVVSRGYKGSAGARGGVVSDGKKMLMAASACGDEAFMMAMNLKDIPVMVGPDRYATGRRALDRFAPQVILLDDAFQHIRLFRDMDLVLLDTEKPFGNGKLFPRGTLREEKTALSRSSAVVLTRAGQQDHSVADTVGRYAPGIPLFECNHHPYVAGVVSREMGKGSSGPPAEGHSDLELLKGKNSYLFSGIAQNERFHRTMEKIGCRICEIARFEDHHYYSDTELKTIMQSAVNSGAELIITTEKDFSRIPSGVKWPLDLVIVGVEIRFLDDAFDQYIRRELRRVIK